MRVHVQQLTEDPVGSVVSELAKTCRHVVRSGTPLTRGAAEPRLAVGRQRVGALWLDEQGDGLEFNRNSQAFRVEGE